jgi:hypothetical protein
MWQQTAIFTISTCPVVTPPNGLECDMVIFPQKGKPDLNQTSSGFAKPFSAQSFIKFSNSSCQPLLSHLPSGPKYFQEVTCSGSMLNNSSNNPLPTHEIFPSLPQNMRTLSPRGYSRV